MIRTLSLWLLTSLPAIADAPEILAAEAREASAGRWQISVTLAHPDMGWDHYASAWEVLAPDGTSLGIRELAHPHTEEQPFTRSLSSVEIPADIDHVLIRARCNLVGWGMQKFRLDLR